MSRSIAILAPQGRLDAVRAPLLEQQLRQELARGNNCLVVDLGATNYISSNGLRVLLAGRKAAEQNGGGLVLCGLGPRLIETFEMVGFDEVFDIYPDRITAEKAFEG